MYLYKIIPKLPRPATCKFKVHNQLIDTGLIQTDHILLIHCTVFLITKGIFHTGMIQLNTDFHSIGMNAVHDVLQNLTLSRCKYSQTRVIDIAMGIHCRCFLYDKGRPPLGKGIVMRNIDVYKRQTKQFAML